MKNAPIQTRAAPKPMSTRPIRSRSISRVLRRGKARPPPLSLGLVAETVQAGGRARPAIHTKFAPASSYFGSRKAQIFRNLLAVRDFCSGSFHFFPMGRSMSVKYSPLLGYGLFVTALLATAGWAAFWGWALWRAVAWT
jgi:hypothetical protein